ncbi:DegT/DnrJ/EryC1/StrS family aminotransferase [Streptomyces sp. NPDC055078]
MTDSGPLVSVLMPCFNRPYLMENRSIPSVLAQTHRAWELVVVSDGLDNHPVRAAVRSFGDSRIRYAEIPRPDYTGLDRTRRWYIAGAAARNHAERLATGEIIALLDDDDAFEPNHLADCVRMLTETGADLCYGLVRLYDANLGEYRDSYEPWDAPGTLGAFLTENVLYTPSVAYRAKWKEPPYPTDGERAADHGKWLAMHAAGAVFTGTEAAQAVYYGDSFDGVLRLTTPGVPPTEPVQQAVRGLTRTRGLTGPGPYTTELESALADRLGVAAAVAVPDAAAGLELALRAVTELRPGRPEVVVPSYAPAATADAVLRAGLTPVLCDVEPLTLTMTADTAGPWISPRTAALLPVHVHGIPCDPRPLRELATAHDLLLVGDAGPALGASTVDGPTGSAGDFEVFGFGEGTPLCCGEGGAVVCRDPELAALLREPAAGRTESTRAGAMGRAGYAGPRLTEFAAAVAVAGLPLLDSWLAARRTAAERYRELLAAVPELRVVGPHPGSDSGPDIGPDASPHPGPDASPHTRPGTDGRRPSWADLTLLTPSVALTARIVTRLADHRIATGTRHQPLHRSPVHARHAAGPLPVADAVAGRVVNVPIGQEIPDESIVLVAGVLRHELAAADRGFA